MPPSPMDPQDPILDPVTALAYLAGITSSVRLGTGVVVLPLRNPLILAKALATVDVLSGGRLIVGIGVGYVEQEFAAIGVPFADRGARLEEHLAAMRSIWSERHPAAAGAFVRSITSRRSHTPSRLRILRSLWADTRRRCCDAPSGRPMDGTGGASTSRLPLGLNVLREIEAKVRGGRGWARSRSRSPRRATSTSRSRPSTRRSGSTG